MPITIDNLMLSNVSVVASNDPLTANLQVYVDATSSTSYSGSGAVWYDLSGNSNNTTLVNTPTFNVSTPSYFAFDGISEYADTNYAYSSGTSAFTLSAWIRKTGTTYALLLLQPGAQASGFGLEIYPTTAYINCQTSSASDFGQFNWNLTGWHEWTVVFDGSGVGNSGRLKTYVDGVEQSMTYTGTIGTSLLNPSASRYFQINKRPWSTIYGQSDFISVLMYNKALNSSEVQYNYNALRTKYGL